jgi:tetratricopeptide (TPR) repeat protein
VEQGEYARAEPLYRSALQIRQQALGAADSLVAEVWNNLGFLCLQQGKYREAETWLEKAFEVWENSTASDVAYAAVALNNLAMLRRIQGGLDAAESLYQRALTAEEKVFGPEHPEVASTRMSLAALYRARGKGGQAMETYRQALAVLEKTVGAQDPLAIETREQLSELVGAAEARGEYQLLVVRTKEEAAQLRTRIENGEDFADLAARHSVDPNASSGGYFRTRVSELREELRAALGRLGAGQVSAVFPLAGKWAIVRKISEPTPAKQ